MKKIKFDKYKIIFWALLTLLLVIVCSKVMYVLNNEVLITSTVDKIVFNNSQPTTLTLNLDNKTLISLTQKDNIYIAYQYIDKENNIDFEKKDVLLITLNSHEQKNFQLPLIAPPKFEEYELKIYLYSDNTLPKYTSLSLNAVNIADNILAENISITTSLKKSNNAHKFTIPLNIINTGNLPLYNDLEYYISYHIYDENRNLIKWDGERTNFESTIYPTQSLTQEIFIRDSILNKSGTYYLELDIVHENFCWFSEHNFTCPTLEITIP